MKKQTCPMCGNGILSKQETAKQFEYKGKIKTIANYVTNKCDSCNEEIVENESLSNAGKELTEFKREVDGLLTAKQIKKIRQEIGLTQEEMAKYLGGGAKGFARYESGSICQSRAMDNLLRILQKFPSMITYLHQEEATFSYDMKGSISSYTQKQFYLTKDNNDNSFIEEVANGS